VNILPVETGKDTDTMENLMESTNESMHENMNESTNEAAHDAIYWQTYRQVLDEGYDVRVARAEAANAEKKARAAARDTERIRIKVERDRVNGQVNRTAGKGAKKRSKKNTGDAIQEKGPIASSRLKLFADVREILQSRASEKNFLAGEQRLSANE